MIVYGDDGKGYYNEDNSRKATQLITSIVESERYPFSDVISADYDDDNSDIRKCVTNFDENTPSRADRLRVPKSLKTLVKNSGLTNHSRNYYVSELLHKLLKDFAR
ncbi:MAG: hypothetical protein K6G53_00170 [Bacteroidales bacterium]|nr:hypothetical protein [Bacteroidales bacterium]